MELLRFLIVWVFLTPTLLIGITVTLSVSGWLWWLLIKDFIDYFSLNYKFIILSSLKTIGLIWLTLLFAVMVYGWVSSAYPIYLEYFK